MDGNLVVTAYIPASTGGLLFPTNEFLFKAPSYSDKPFTVFTAEGNPKYAEMSYKTSLKIEIQANGPQNVVVFWLYEHE